MSKAAVLWLGVLIALCALAAYDQWWSVDHPIPLNGVTVPVKLKP